MLFAVILLYIYLMQIREWRYMFKLNELKYKLDLDNLSKVLESDTGKSKLYWLLFLASANIIILFSSTIAPMMSFLQLLPILEKDAGQSSLYNFNSNLRFSIPIVLKIMLPMFIFLNGFVFYSLLLYPGKYFDDYMLGFFSYIYQNFQTGTY